MIYWKKLVRTILMIFWMTAGVVLLNACDSHSAGKKRTSEEEHQAQIQNRGSGMLYVDKISCNTVIQSAGSAGTADFHCFLVGFIDSVPAVKTDGKKDLATGRYYQYDMQHDWVALANGDSLKPVFFHPKQKLTGQRNEGILVFETTGKEPDTLIYKDSYGSWGVQQIIIRSNQK